jgi:hypothetical protein
MTPSEKDRAKAAAWVHAQIAAAPPLSQEQAYRLKQMLGGVTQDRGERSATVERRSKTFRKTA